MNTVAVEGARTKLSIGLASAVAYAGAAAFLVAGGWYGLAAEGVTVDSQPVLLGTQSVQERVDIYYGWLVTTFAQERIYTGFAIFGFLCVMATAVSMRARIARGGTAALLGVLALGTGSAIWVVGNLISLGGHHTVELMFARREPIDVLNSINLAVDVVDDAFELASFMLLGVGMLALASPAMKASSRQVAWGRFSGVVGLVLLATAGAYAAQSYDLIDILLVVGGAVLVPIWLVWTGRLLRGAADTG